MTGIKLKNAYNPIDINSKFSSDDFFIEYQKVNALEKTLEALKKDSNDLNSVKNAGILTYGNPNFYSSMPNAGMMARYASEKASKDGSENLIQYTIKNSTNLYSFLNPEEKLGLLTGAEVLKAPEEKDEKDKTDKNKEYNDFAELANLHKGLSEIVQSDTPESKQAKVAFIANQSQYSPRWMQEMNQSFGSNQKYIDAIFQEYLVQISGDYMRTVIKEDGKINVEKVNKFSNINFKLHNNAKEKDFNYFNNLKELGFSSIVKFKQKKEAEEKKKAEEEAKKQTKK